MDFIKDLVSHISPENIVHSGYIFMAIIIFAETGLLAGYFLPGDTLLVTAGVFAAHGDLNIVSLNILLIVCAIVGDAVGYMIGRQAGKALFARPDSRFFKRKYLEQTQAFYDKHGGKTIIIARFVPVVRTFAPTVAGAALMPYSRFAMFNVVGGALWIVSLTMLGYLLANVVPNIDKMIDKVILLIVVISVLPIVWHSVKTKLDSRKTKTP
jgi:membrane-associated protein